MTLVFTFATAPSGPIERVTLIATPEFPVGSVGESQQASNGFLVPETTREALGRFPPDNDAPPIRTDTTGVGGFVTSGAEGIALAAAGGTAAAVGGLVSVAVLEPVAPVEFVALA